MSNEPCKRILTEHGFHADDIDVIINELPNIESINQYAKEVHGKVRANKNYLFQEKSLNKELKKQ